MFIVSYRTGGPWRAGIADDAHLADVATLHPSSEAGLSTVRGLLEAGPAAIDQALTLARKSFHSGSEGLIPRTAVELGPPIPDPQTLETTTRVNGITLQQGNTKDMIFPVSRTIAFLSSLMTLGPGDLIATGTPSGVGFRRNPPIFLKAGDVVDVEIRGIGVIRNPVVRPADGDQYPYRQDRTQGG